MRLMSIRHRRRGFSLLEMLVALALLGILAMIAIPRLSSTTAAHGVVEEARLVHERVALARTRAIAERTDYRVSLTGGHTLAVDRLEGGVWNSVYVSEPFDADIEIDGSVAGSIVLQGRGMVDAPKTFRLERDGHVQVVRVLASGLLLWEEDP